MLQGLKKNGFLKREGMGKGSGGRKGRKKRRNKKSLEVPSFLLPSVLPFLFLSYLCIEIERLMKIPMRNK